jgi:diketogulonate reductase-like aldo/keto reductase
MDGQPTIEQLARSTLHPMLDKDTQEIKVHTEGLLKEIVKSGHLSQIGVSNMDMNPKNCTTT